MIETFVSNIANWLPFGYSFGAGMITTVSPCGIAMLPAYVSLYIGTEGGTNYKGSFFRRSIRAMIMGGMMTSGFVLLFGAVGVIVSFGGQYLLFLVPWIAVLIGVLLILFGVLVLFRGHVYTRLPVFLAARFGKPGDFTFKGLLFFGVAYGVAALSCTLPVFLSVVAAALIEKGFTYGLLQFISFALGMGLVVITVSMGSALFKDSVNRWLRFLGPVITPLSGLLLIFAGSYILYFWFEVGDILSWTLS